MHGTRSGGSAPAPRGPAALQPSAAEPTANVQAVGAAVPRARGIPLPKASELTQSIKVPSVNLTPHGCLTKTKRNDALVHSIADGGTRAQPSRGAASELPVAGRSPNPDESALFRTEEFQARRAARQQPAAAQPAAAGPRAGLLLGRRSSSRPRGLAAAAAGCEPTPAASAGVGADWLSATDGATPSTKPIDNSAVDPVADSVAAAEQARLTAAWLD